MLNNKAVRYTLIAILSAVFVFSSVMLIKTVSDSKKTDEQFDELAELVSLPEDNTSSEAPATSESGSTVQKPAAPALQPITRNIALLHERNSDCVGWVYIAGTRVNYPVMYTPDKPEKYLKRDFYGRIMGSGVPFIDARCNLDSTNIIIYGHNMKNLSMFGGLRKYLDKSYLKAHPTIEFETLDGCVKYDIIDVRKTDIKDDWYTHNLDGNQDGKEYLTLSTCYGLNKNARLLVIAVKQTETQ
ncbi:MAG: sortase [Ruminococcaceae bacterium]|nr:sortase [Oscillospiraceae bacterium]